MKLRDRQALKDWEAYRKSLIAATSIDLDEDQAQKLKRINKLLQDFNAFCKYYFPKYATHPFAPFHNRFAKVVCSDIEAMIITRWWARDHAKSVDAGLFIPVFLMCNGRLNNMILASWSYDNAKELLMPLQLNLESNQRLINDFGPFKGIGNWEDGKFITRTGHSFRAIGSGQSPRGTRNEEARPDFILLDDFDEDELCRNPKRLDEAEDWAMGALFGSLSITGRKRFIAVGNLIAKDSVLTRITKVADDHEQINILDDNGEPSWERFTKEECRYMIDKVGYRRSQREYFNNPISEGKVFKKEWIQYKHLPQLNQYYFLVSYLDPGFKKTKGSDTKAMVLVGLHEGKFHVHKVFCSQASVEEMVEWGYIIDRHVKDNGGAYTFWMEEVFLQDLLYKNFSAAAIAKGYPVPVRGDTRKKPDKDVRIEAMSGYFERGDVYFNENEKDNHHMQALIEQLLTFEPKVKSKKDGPDALEGAIHLLSKMISLSPNISAGTRTASSRHKIV
jgi:predicted phage terminase large subunit-like protein